MPFYYQRCQKLKNVTWICQQKIKFSCIFDCHYINAMVMKLFNKTNISYQMRAISQVYHSNQIKCVLVFRRFSIVIKTNRFYKEFVIMQVKIWCIVVENKELIVHISLLLPRIGKVPLTASRYKNYHLRPKEN